MVQTQDSIAQRIHERRGLYTKKRRKRFLFLKHTGQYEEDYRQRRAIKVVKKQSKITKPRNH